METQMIRKFRSYSVFSVVLLCGSLVFGCGGSKPPSSSFSFLVSPATAEVWQGDTAAFSAPVEVNWSIKEGSAGGSISSAGVYTAPGVPGTYHIIATSLADPSNTGEATVTVPSISIVISPSTVALGVSQQRQFSAEITGTVNTVNLAWYVIDGATGGTITADGLYTAPTTTGTYHVEAVSSSDANIKGEASITVLSSGYFSPAASMSTPRAKQTATRLPDGKVLIAGGIDGDSSLRSAELFDPATNTFSPTGNMVSARDSHTATLLPNGKVLIAGGESVSASSQKSLASAELYDPATGTFTPTADMNRSRLGDTATLLANGTVLIAGGGLANEPRAEIYDPDKGSFTLTGTLTASYGRAGHAAVLLADGKVLLAGGFDFNDILDSAELYDPSSGQFTPTGDLTEYRSFFTLSLLPDGRVLAAGGLTDGECGSSCEPLQVAGIYDPKTGVFTPTGQMLAPHGGHTATVLGNGKVLIAGGETSEAELYDPASGTFSLAGSLMTQRTYHTATLLKDGRVLVTGGLDGAQHPLASVEIYK